MTHRRNVLTATIFVVGLFALSACGVSVDRVEDELGRGDTTTTVAADPDGPSTTTADGTTTTPPTTGGSSGTSDPAAEPYVQAMVDSMVDDDEFPGTEDQARCFAEASVGIIGADRLESQGITPDELGSDDALDLSDVGLTMDEGNEIYDALGECGIDMRQLMFDSMSEDDELTPEVRACLEQVLTDDNLRKLVVISMVEGDDAAEDNPELEALTFGLMGCMFMAMGSETSTP